MIRYSKSPGRQIINRFKSNKVIKYLHRLMNEDIINKIKSIWFVSSYWDKF